MVMNAFTSSFTKFIKARDIFVQNPNYIREEQKTDDIAHMLGYFNDNVVKCHTEYITAINNVIHSPKLRIVSEVIMTK